MKGGKQTQIAFFAKKRFFGEVFRRFAVLSGATVIIASSISISSDIGKNCFLGSIQPNFAEKLAKTGFSKFSLEEFYIPAFCCAKNVGVESLYCGGELESAYGYVDPNANYLKPQRVAVILALNNKTVAKNDDWHLSKFYNFSLPPAWNPSIPIAYRRLII